MRYFIVLAIITLFSCDNTSENKNEKTNSLVKLYEKSDNTHKFYIYSNNDQIKIGYKKFYVKVENNGSVLTNAKVSLAPLMDMGSHKHAAPFENPVTNIANSDGLYESAVLFQMAGYWSLSFTSIVGTDTNKVTIDSINVLSSQLVMKKTGSDASMYFLTMMDSAFKVGINDLKVTLHKKETMMSFPSVNNYQIEITPWMPSMNHGSSNNVNPSHSENGHYEGKVNFSMSGDWEIRFKIKSATNDSITSFTYILDL